MRTPHCATGAWRSPSAADGTAARSAASVSCASAAPSPPPAAANQLTACSTQARAASGSPAARSTSARCVRATSDGAEVPAPAGDLDRLDEGGPRRFTFTAGDLDPSEVEQVVGLGRLEAQRARRAGRPGEVGLRIGVALLGLGQLPPQPLGMTERPVVTEGSQQPQRPVARGPAAHRCLEPSAEHQGPTRSASSPTPRHLDGGPHPVRPLDPCAQHDPVPPEAEHDPHPQLRRVVGGPRERGIQVRALGAASEVRRLVRLGVAATPVQRGLERTVRPLPACWRARLTSAVSRGRSGARRTTARARRRGRPSRR